jgi:hypothetical protein
MPYLLSVLPGIKNKEALAGPRFPETEKPFERHRFCASTASVAAVRRINLTLASIEKRPLLYRG